MNQYSTAKQLYKPAMRLQTAFYLISNQKLKGKS
jgi:hypothetical protein